MISPSQRSRLNRAASKPPRFAFHDLANVGELIANAGGDVRAGLAIGVSLANFDNVFFGKPSSVMPFSALHDLRTYARVMPIASRHAATIHGVLGVIGKGSRQQMRTSLAERRVTRVSDDQLARISVLNQVRDSGRDVGGFLYCKKPVSLIVDLARPNPAGIQPVVLANGGPKSGDVLLRKLRKWFTIFSRQCVLLGSSCCLGLLRCGNTSQSALILS